MKTAVLAIVLIVIVISLGLSLGGIVVKSKPLQSITNALAGKAA